MNTRPTQPRNTERPAEGASQFAPELPAPPAPAQPVDLWVATYRSLRGRWRLALALAAVGACVGVGAGFMLGKRLYSATGLVRIASVLPHVMRETDQNRPIANLDGFMQAQRDVMSSPEIIEAAMNNDAWTALAATKALPSQEQFALGLKVEARPKSDHLRVTFTDKRPDVAAAAVRSTIDAFQHAFLEEQNKIEDQRMGQLTQRRDSLTADLRGVSEQMASVAQGRTLAEIDPLSSAALERLKKLKGMLADVQCVMAGGPDLTSRPYTPTRTSAEIAADERQRYWAAERLRVVNQLAQYRAQGFGPLHPVMVRLVASAKECDEQLDLCNQAVEERRAAAADSTPPVSLADREASLINLLRAADEEVKQSASQRSRLKALDEQAVSLRASLNETNSRLDALATEAALSGRLTVVSAGDRPLTAVLDNRAKCAAVGAAAGIGLPLASMVLLGAHRRRYRYCDEVAADLSGRAPFVAALPDLMDFGPLSAVAAHCVHDLHVRLQPHRGSETRVYLVTSAASGEGKTSLAIALGLSFATAGFRTLLIDGDLTTRRLTRGLECDNEPGLFEAADGAEPCTRRLRCNMSILPVGRCRPQDSWKLAPAATSRVLAAVKEKFDVIIIDGDPILTGIRASVMATQADGVILNVVRGQEQSLVENAVRHLSMLGAVLAGAVFNRAGESEFRAALREQPQSPALGHRRLPEKLHRFGPLVATMLSSLSLSRESDLDLSPSGPVLAMSDESRQAA